MLDLAKAEVYDKIPIFSFWIKNEVFFYWIMCGHNSPE
jgi:hypothetical protein